MSRRGSVRARLPRELCASAPVRLAPSRSRGRRHDRVFLSNLSRGARRRPLMPEYLAPAVYVEETSFRSKSIEGVGTSTTGFVGMTARGPVAAGAGAVAPPLLTSFSDFELYYGGVDDLSVGNPAAA